MRIKKYNQYMIQALLESVIVSTGQFKNFLCDFPRGSKIADILYNMIDDREDIKTTYNYIDNSDKNDEISFIPDNQYQRFKEKGEDVSTKTKSKAKIGRMIRQILKDNGHNFSEPEIEKFVNQFKSTWDFQHGVGRKIEVVKGDDIIHWYNENNYFKNEGTLGNSCMRYDSKSEFMRIYADNPDKISMATIRQNDKLMARALVWKLDDGRVFLDRIYAIKDSDVELLYNWALQNIGGNNPDNMPSHYKGRQGTIMCSLDKTIEEQYPYADSMYYLFQEIKDGKLTGKGFTSNNWDDSNNQKYLVRVIQNTDGGSDIKNYKYSEYLDKFINNSEAVWCVDLDSYMYENDTVYCRFRSNKYYKDNCVFNEIIQDWIPKRNAVEHEKYGWILPDMLKDVIMAYTGKETDALKIWLDMDRKGSSVLKIEQELKNSPTFAMFRPERSPVSGFYSEEFRVRDYGRDSQVNFLSYKMYALTDEIPKDLEFLVVRYNYEWITETDAEIFGLNVDKSTTTYISAYDYLYLFDTSVYSQLLEKIDQSSAPQNLKSQRIEMASTIHEYLLDNSSEYQFTNKLAEKLPSLNYLKTTLDLFQKAFERREIYEYSGNDVTLKEYIKLAGMGELVISDNINPETVERYKNSMPYVYKYFKMLMFFYVLKGDAYDAIELLAEFVKQYYRDDFNQMRYDVRDDERNYTESCFYLMRRILRNGAEYEIRNTFNEVLQEFADKYDMNRSSLRSRFIAKSIEEIENGISSADFEILNTLID